MRKPGEQQLSSSVVDSETNDTYNSIDEERCFWQSCYRTNASIRSIMTTLTSLAPPNNRAPTDLSVSYDSTGIRFQVCSCIDCVEKVSILQKVLQRNASSLGLAIDEKETR